MTILAGVSLGVAPRLVSRALVSSVPNTENPLVQVSLSAFGALDTTEGSGGGVVTNRLPEWWGQAFSSAATNIGAGFQVRCSVSSGDAPSGGSPVNVWLSMTLTNAWQLFRNTVGTSTGVWLVEIRSVGSGTIIATAAYTMTATKNP